MIKYIDRHNLDEKKYNDCINASYQKRIYAFSWYLDIVSSNWGVIVLNDYEAVMPLPWKKKYFIKYLFQPFFCQQLGVFSIKENHVVVAEFINSIPNEFKKIYIQFNSSNALSETMDISERVNYILPLEKNYQQLFKSFTKGRKHAVNQALKNELNISNFNIDELIIIAKEHYDFGDFSSKEYELLAELVEKLETKSKILLLGVRDSSNNLIGGSVFVQDSSRITYLFSAMTEEGKSKQVPSFLINKVIEKYCESGYILDFEGSMISGIASFFKSFGATKESYMLLQKSKLPKI